MSWPVSWRRFWPGERFPLRLRLRVYGPEGTFLGLGTVDRGANELKILKLFV